jgi:hypothetical protein
MTKYILIGGLAFSSTTAWGQFPLPAQSTPPASTMPPGMNSLPREPGLLPRNGSFAPTPVSGDPNASTKNPTPVQQAPALDANGMPLPKPEVPLVRTERVQPLGKIDVKFTNNNWQVWAGPHVFANFGTDWKSAEKTAGTLQAMQTGETGKSTIGDVQLTGWATLGDTRPVIGYMTMRGEAIRSFKGVSNTALPIDLATVRTEAIRGVWVVRDASNILLNFGQDEREAEQAVAVAKRYGFNRIGFVGSTDTPSLRYFFTASEVRKPVMSGANPSNAALTAMMQETNLDRTGIDVPGAGVVGQKINLDPKKLDVRRDGSDFVLAQGGDVLAKFGRDEFSARDAQRAIQQMRPTAFVRIGSPGIMFFLTGAEPPNRLPFGTMGAAFDADRLSVRQSLDGVHHLCDPLGREIASTGTKADADAIRMAIKHFKLNRTCQIGSSPAYALTFLGRAN